MTSWIESLINKIIEKLQAAEGLSEIKWHYGEPIKWVAPEKGEGYVSLVPAEQFRVEPYSMQCGSMLVYPRILICVAYKHVDEETCDKFVQEKTEEIWKVITQNPSWDNLCRYSRINAFAFYGGKEADYSFNFMFTFLTVEKTWQP